MNFPVIKNVLAEENQTSTTRVHLFRELEKLLGRPVITYFTSFVYPVIIDDSDAVMIEGVLQHIDQSKGFALIIDSPGGDGLAAERIINICRSYSKTGEYWVIVPNQAKSAATIICLGASKIFMSATSELGPIDPQLTIKEASSLKRYSVYNLIESYESLFGRAVRAKGNLEPYLQQLARYDERDIKEFRSVLDLSEDIAIKVLKSGMMKGDTKIREKMQIFLSPKSTKIHARPIFRDEAKKCGLNIDSIDIDSKLWELIFELYIRTNHFVNTKVTKCIECEKDSFFAGVGSHE
ncbi:MAG: hypothetical protein NTY09_13950 [bacterium]|nr:hypothetical protein [bacterium]